MATFTNSANVESKADTGLWLLREAMAAAPWDGWKADSLADQAISYLVAAKRTAEGQKLCPGCNGRGTSAGIGDIRVNRCTGCGGFFTLAPVTLSAAVNVVRVDLDMLANAGPDGQFYFDLDLVGGRRIHGWADRETRRVVQWG